MRNGITKRSVLYKQRFFSTSDPPLSSYLLKTLSDPSPPTHLRHVDEICKALITSSDPTSAPHLLLDSLHVTPSEPIVAGVLKRLSNSSLLALAFFRWARAHPSFSHSTGAYNAVVDSLGKVKQFRKAWEIVDEMKLRGILGRETFSLVARRYGRAKMADETVKTYNMMEEKYGFALGIDDFNKLIDTLCKSKHVVRAQKVFDEMRKRRKDIEPDIKTYTVLLEGWGDKPDLRKLEEIWAEIETPDVVAYGIKVNAYSKSRMYDEAVEIFESMEENGVSPSPHIFCTMIIGLGSAGRLEEALGFFRRSKEAGIAPEGPTYNAVVGAYCWAGKIEEAMKTVDEMRALGIGPNSRTYDIIMHRLFKAGKKDEALAIFDKIQGEEGVVMGPSTYEIASRMISAKPGGARLAEEKVWVPMRSRGVVPGMQMFSTMVLAMCRDGDLDSACRFFEDMIEIGIRPPARLFEDLKRCLIGRGRDDTAQALADKLQRFKRHPFF